MNRALRREDGFTLVELLLVCVISLVVFGVTVTAWTSIYRANRSVESQNDNAESARVALDRAARQLRNLANPTVNAVTTIYRATDYDFIFQTSDPAKTWVRYCLATSGSNGATLYESEHQTAINAGMTTGCPNTTWDRTSAVVPGVTNQLGGIDRNVFTYECSVNAATPCTQEFAGTDWRGVTYTKKFSGTDIGQSRSFYLLVRDPGCLTSLSPQITITSVS
jgi:type II secretory pathway pseudopilin PulG